MCVCVCIYQYIYLSICLPIYSVTFYIVAERRALLEDSIRFVTHTTFATADWEVCFVYIDTDVYRYIYLYIRLSIYRSAYLF